MTVLVYSVTHTKPPRRNVTLTMSEKKKKKISSVHPGMTPCTFGFHRKVYCRQENESVGIKSGSWRTHTSSTRHTHFRCGVGRPLPIKCHKSSSYGADKNRSTVREAFEDGVAAASLLWFSKTPHRQLYSSEWGLCKPSAARWCCPFPLLACSICVMLKNEFPTNNAFGVLFQFEVLTSREQI